MREPVTKVFRRAGCGKSARPVRRGDGESRLIPLLSVLLYRPIGLRFWSAPQQMRLAADKPGWAARWRPTRADENVIHRNTIAEGADVERTVKARTTPLQGVAVNS